MFDDPKKELSRLQQALLEVEEPEEVFPEPEEEEEDYPQWYAELRPVENPAVDFGRMLCADDAPDPDCLEMPRGKAARKARKQAKKEKKQRKKQKRKKKHTGLFLITVLAEIAVILYLLRWWVLWLT